MKLIRFQQSKALDRSFFAMNLANFAYCLTYVIFHISPLPVIIGLLSWAVINLIAWGVQIKRNKQES